MFCVFCNYSFFPCFSCFASPPSISNSLSFIYHPIQDIHPMDFQSTCQFLSKQFQDNPSYFPIYWSISSRKKFRTSSRYVHAVQPWKANVTWHNHNLRAWTCTKKKSADSLNPRYVLPLYHICFQVDGPMTTFCCHEAKANNSTLQKPQGTKPQSWNLNQLEHPTILLRQIILNSAKDLRSNSHLQLILKWPTDFAFQAQKYAPCSQFRFRSILINTCKSIMETSIQTRVPDVNVI